MLYTLAKGNNEEFLITTPPVHPHKFKLAHTLGVFLQRLNDCLLRHGIFTEQMVKKHKSQRGYHIDCVGTTLLQYLCPAIGMGCCEMNNQFHRTKA